MASVTRKGTNMRRTFALTLAVVGVLALAAGISAAGASTKFAYTQELIQTGIGAGTAVVSFQEGSLKRFVAVDYQLDATATATSLTFCDDRQIIDRTFPQATVTLIPDESGRVSGTLTLVLDPPQLSLDEEDGQGGVAVRQTWTRSRPPWPKSCAVANHAAKVEAYDRFSELFGVALTPKHT
jgi:hypothetical protein